MHAFNTCVLPPQAAPQGCSLRTLELRLNGLALEVGDAFGRLLAGAWASGAAATSPSAAATSTHLPRAAQQRSRASSMAGPTLLAGAVLQGPRLSHAHAQSPPPPFLQPHHSAPPATGPSRPSTSSAARSPAPSPAGGTTRMGPLEAAAAAAHQQVGHAVSGVALRTHASVDCARPGAGAPLVLLPSNACARGGAVVAEGGSSAATADGSVNPDDPLQQQQQQQQQGGGLAVCTCFLTSLDLGSNPLLGDVGVCKLAAGLATHCRHV